MARRMAWLALDAVAFTIGALTAGLAWRGILHRAGIQL